MTTATGPRNSTRRPARYICPHSGAALELTGDRLVSVDGRVSYLIEDGVPNFVSTPVSDDGGRAGVRRALEITKSQGWRAAIDEIYPPGTLENRYITDDTRTGYLDLLPIDQSSRVLEIGASMGQHTVAIARRAGFVDGIELILEQAQFALERCRQEGLSNVALACGGADCRLPYTDGAFDVVVLSLVLEWCGAQMTGEEHVEAQNRLLGEIHRVLRPGGALYLSTKNRFAARLLVGGRDEHTHELPLGSCLPRPLMKLQMRLAGKRRAGGWLHSYRALRRMLVAKGFTSLRSFWLIPDFRYPRRFVPTDVGSVREARSSGEAGLGETRTVRKIMRLVPASWVKHLASSLTFVAERR